ncbi:MAG: type II toxin-antitoxin system HicB family antitoxin [Actinobacteria bacterium]|nr:type II toxin-antitoxin system HicB family antitoxin [Actinomycetota bacterium]
MRFRYAVNLIWSREDDGYIATIPELPGLSAFGGTAGIATREMERAAEAFVDAMSESGSPVPSPLEMPSFSGQFRVRLPVSMHKSLVVRAGYEGVSLNTLIVSLLAEGLGINGERFLRKTGPSLPDRDFPGVPR